MGVSVCGGVHANVAVVAASFVTRASVIRPGTPTGARQSGPGQSKPVDSPSRPYVDGAPALPPLPSGPATLAAPAGLPGWPAGPPLPPARPAPGHGDWLFGHAS